MLQGYHHLTYEQRCQIYILKDRGDPLTSIGKSLSVHRTTISRELKRNSGRNGYFHEQAQKKSKQRRLEAVPKNQKMTSKVVSIIKQKLKLQWSPVQISGRIKIENVYVSHETI